MSTLSVQSITGVQNFDLANTSPFVNAYATINTSYTVVNAAYTVANAAYGAANVEYTFSNTIYAAVNSVFGVANAGFGRANTALQNTSGTFAGTMQITGSLGIGIAPSTFTTDIAGTIRALSSSEGIQTTGDTIGRDFLAGKSTVATCIGYAGNTAMVQGTNFSLSSTPDLSLQPYGGRVGIGTSSPNDKLTVYGASTVYSDTVSGGTSGTNSDWAYHKVTVGGTYSGSVYNLIYGGGIAYTYYSANNGQYWIGTSQNSPLILYTNNAERMRIDSSGNVGIGTTSPTSRLQLLAPVGDSLPILKLSASSNTSSPFQWISTALAPNIGAGQNLIHLIGKSQSTPNSGYIGYKHSSDGSYNNSMTIGMYGADNLLNVNAYGHVTKPNQPAFWLTNLSWSTSIQRPHNGTVWSNIGSHYNNTNVIFTAPVAGRYMFICTVQGHNPGETTGRNATYFNLKANINGADYGNEIVATCQESVGGKHDQITHCVLVVLAANDTFYFASNYGFRTVQNSYIGYLLG